MVLRQLYARPVDTLPPCRRHLFPVHSQIDELRHGKVGICLWHLLPWLEPGLLPCSNCNAGRGQERKEVHLCPLPTKETRASLNGSSGSVVKRSTMFDSFPEIWAFLTSTSAPDGSPRLPGTVSLSLNAGVWTLALKDLATGLYGALSSSSIDDLVLSVEARMAEGTMPWRVDKYPGQKPRK
jgi:hypothetical protein